MWERSHHLTVRAYELTRRFPKKEMFGLTSQLCWAAVSVELNLAEPRRPAFCTLIRQVYRGCAAKNRFFARAVADE